MFYFDYFKKDISKEELEHSLHPLFENILSIGKYNRDEDWWWVMQIEKPVACGITSLGLDHTEILGACFSDSTKFAAICFVWLQFYLQFYFMQTFITFYLSDLFVMHLLSCIQFDSYYKLVTFQFAIFLMQLKLKITPRGGEEIWMPN